MPISAGRRTVDAIVARITAAVACGHCGAELPSKGASGDFCNDNCQSAWHRLRATNPYEVLHRPEPHFNDGPRYRFESDETAYRTLARRLLERDAAAFRPDVLIDDSLLPQRARPGLWRRLMNRYHQRKADE